MSHCYHPVPKIRRSSPKNPIPFFCSREMVTLNHMGSISTSRSRQQVQPLSPLYGIYQRCCYSVPHRCSFTAAVGSGPGRITQAAAHHLELNPPEPRPLDRRLTLELPHFHHECGIRTPKLHTRWQLSTHRRHARHDGPTGCSRGSRRS